MKALILIGMFLLQQAQPQPSGVIAGRILFRDGLPATRARVTTSVSAPTRPPAITDDSGNYRLEGLPAGSYYIRASLPGLNLLYPGVASESEASVVTVAQGATVNNIDIVVPDAFSGVRVSGRVNFPPVQMASVTTQRVQLSSGGSVSIAADGSFEFRHVLPGSYTLNIPSPGTQPARIAVADKDVTGVELSVPRIVAVSGTVTMESGARPALSFTFEGPGFRTTAAMQPNGTFSAQLPEGPYLVGVVGGALPAGGRAAAPPTFPAGYYLRSFGNESQNLLTGLLRIGPSESAVRLAVVLGTSPGVKVTGRVTTGANDSSGFASKKVNLTSAATNESAEAQIDPNGSFEIPRMMPGTYVANVALTPEIRSAPTTVVIPNRDLSELVLTVPEPVEVAGRVAVDGNGPPPKFSLALVRGGNFTPRVDANGIPSVDLVDLLVLVRGGGAHVIQEDVSALPDGSFRMTLPQGDYRVIPAVQSPAYFIRSLTHGSSRLLTEPLHVSDSEHAELHIGFGTTATNSWKKVSGHVSGLDPVKGPVRISLESSLTATIETPVNPDGSFEFFSVLPGTRYTARLIPTSDAAPSPPVTVADKDVEGIEIVVPREREVSIKASVEGNAPIPMFMLSLSTFTTVAGRETTTSSVSALIKPEADGTFKATLPEDERRVRISGFPMGYSVKSMTYGSVDLLRNPVKLNAVVPTGITVAFAIDPSIPFGNVQGRVTGLDPDQRDVRLVLNGAAAFATFEVELGANGSFSFSKIPQGVYVPTLTGAVTSGLLSPTSLVVTGREITGIEISFPKGSTRPNRPNIEPVPTGTMAADLSDINSVSRKSANESAAVANLRTLNTALITYLAASGGKYGSLSDLISAGLLDSTFNGVKAGFAFSIVPVGSDYAAVAIPGSGDLARYGFYATADAIIHYSPLEFLAPPRRSGNIVQ